MSLEIDLEQRDRILIVRLKGELDHHTSDELKKQLESAIEEADIQHIILSLKNLQFMDSSGIGVILGRYKKISQKQGEMVVCSINPTIKRLFELSGLFKILKLKESEEDALHMLGVA
ncbi:MAG: anti-sigma F factor antagonist [Bacillaceae bacterium]|nr:anti-sigma F factor antagonist [Bacillaceae bacterium]